MRAATEKFTFPNAQGDVLSGRLELPAGPVRAVAVFAHCFTCSKNVLAAVRISRELCRRGFAVLRFDFTGLGNSEGDFSNTGFSSNVEDVVQAARALREWREAPALLVGHSFGGAAALAAASRVPEVRAVVTIGAPAEPAHVARHLGSAREEIETTGRARVVLAGRDFTIKREFLEDITEKSLAEELGNLGKALLILHSPADEVVEIENARKIFEAARHPKSFVSLDGVDHLLTKREDAAYVAELIAAWAERYLPERRREDQPPAEGEVLVEEAGPRYGQVILAGEHELSADEPEAAGGEDTGPTPYGLLLAALGACTSMTLRMYADHKEWPVEKISVRLRHEKVHAEDCAECAAREGKIDRLDVEIDVRGPLSDEKRRRLLEIAGKCPVHRTLAGEKEIRVRWAGQSS